MKLISREQRWGSQCAAPAMDPAPKLQGPASKDAFGPPLCFPAVSAGGGGRSLPRGGEASGKELTSFSIGVALL